MDKDMKIAIVEDCSTMPRIVGNLLRDLGYGNIFGAARIGMEGCLIEAFTAETLHERIDRVFARRPRHMSRAASHVSSR